MLSNYASILEMLLRLRQACAHPYLALARPSGDASRARLSRELLQDALRPPAGEACDGGAAGDSAHGAFESASSRGFLRGVAQDLREGSIPDCPICLEPCSEPVWPSPPASPINTRSEAAHLIIYARADPQQKTFAFSFYHVQVITPCAHIFCRDCASQVLAKEPRRSKLAPSAGTDSLQDRSAGLGTEPCPVCRKPLRRGELRALPRASRFSVDLRKSWHSSSKVDALLRDLQRIRAGQPPAGFQEDSGETEVAYTAEETGGKSVVFSQWTSLLDILEVALERADESFVRLDGSMTAEKRAAALRRFEASGGPRVLLMSLKAGGVGLNLVHVRHCFLMDLWWNPQV